jgi:DNA-binding NtrC family response regulator
MTPLLPARAVVASDDPSVCDATVDLLSQCGITRAIRVRSAQALNKVLQEDPPEVAILAMPMFDVGAPEAGKSFQASTPPFVVITDGEIQSVHRLMDRAFDLRWPVSAILNRPIDASRLVDVLAKLLRRAEAA